MANADANRFGQIAIRQGMTSKSAVDECLQIQGKLRSLGVEPKRIGEILADKGYLTVDQVKEVLKIQKNSVKPTIAAPEPADDDFDIPNQLAGYEIIELLGRGGMGAVYKARQASLDRIVAIKVLPPRIARNRQFIQRFFSEARTVAKLNHKNIIAGIDVGEDKGFNFFVMEYVEGSGLDAIIQAEGALSEEFALQIMVQIGRALEHADKNGLVHRDVKPQNILIDKNDLAKLCDLGLAKSQDDMSGSGENRNKLLGTPHYLSPEQAKGEAVDIRSDLYSLGATCFHMVTGRPPFDGQSPMVLMTKHLTEIPVSPRKLNPTISKGFSELILGLLHKEPDDRPQNPQELLEDLDRVASGKKPRNFANLTKRSMSGRQSRQGRGRGKSNKSGGKRRSNPSHDDYRRRRRHADIRQQKKTEDNSLIIFIVTILILGAGCVYTIFGTTGPVDFSKPVTTEEEVEASEKLRRIYIWNQQNPGQTSELKGLYQSLINEHPRTQAASTARKRLKAL